MATITTLPAGNKVRVDLNKSGSETSIQMITSIEEMSYSDEVTDLSNVRMHGKTMTQLGVPGSTDLERWNYLRITKPVRQLNYSNVFITDGAIVNNGISEYSNHGFIEFIVLSNSIGNIYLSSNSPATYDDASGTLINASGGLTYGTKFRRCLKWTLSTNPKFTKSEWVYQTAQCFDDFDLIDLFSMSGLRTPQYGFYDKSLGRTSMTEDGVAFTNMFSSGDFSTSADFGIIRGVGFPNSTPTTQKSPSTSLNVSRVYPNCFFVMSAEKMTFISNCLFQSIRFLGTSDSFLNITATSTTSISFAIGNGINNPVFGTLNSGKVPNFTTPNGMVMLLHVLPISSTSCTLRMYYANDETFDPLTDYKDVTLTGLASPNVACGIPTIIIPGAIRFHEMFGAQYNQAQFQLTNSLIGKIVKLMFNKIK